MKFDKGFNPQARESLIMACRHIPAGYDCFNPQARESLIVYTVLKYDIRFMFQSAGSREPDHSVHAISSHFVVFQSAGSREPDQLPTKN